MKDLIFNRKYHDLVISKFDESSIDITVSTYDDLCVVGLDLNEIKKLHAWLDSFLQSQCFKE